MSTYRDLSELSGYTARVSELLDTMDDVKQGKYQKKLVGGGSTAGRTVGKGDEVAENAKSASLLLPPLCGCSASSSRSAVRW